MNKFQKREVKLAKNIMRNCREGTDLSKFRGARRYVRCVLYNRQKEYLRIIEGRKYER